MSPVTLGTCLRNNCVPWQDRLFRFTIDTIFRQKGAGVPKDACAFLCFAYLRHGLITNVNEPRRRWAKLFLPFTKNCDLLPKCFAIQAFFRIRLKEAAAHTPRLRNLNPAYSDFRR